MGGRWMGMKNRRSLHCTAEVVIGMESLSQKPANILEIDI